MASQISTSCGMRIKVDAHDVARLKPFSWRIVRNKNGTVKVVTDMRVEGKKKTVLLGSFLLKPELGMRVIRKNSDSLDYRRSNLIVVSASEVRQSSSKGGSALSSRFKGVSKAGEFWRSRINYQGLSIHLGYFESERDAALAYNNSARSLYGKFAKVNDVGEE